jgi:hypothetical protein
MQDKQHHTPTTATTPNIIHRMKEGSSGFLDIVDF